MKSLAKATGLIVFLMNINFSTILGITPIKQALRKYMSHEMHGHLIKFSTHFFQKRFAIRMIYGNTIVFILTGKSSTHNIPLKSDFSTLL